MSTPSSKDLPDHILAAFADKIDFMLNAMLPEGEFPDLKWAVVVQIGDGNSLVLGTLDIEDHKSELTRLSEFQAESLDGVTPRMN